METVLKQSYNLRLGYRQKSHGSWGEYRRRSFSMYHSIDVGVVTVQRENLIYSVEVLWPSSRSSTKYLS